MHLVPAFAEATDTTSNPQIVLICAGYIAGGAILAFIPSRLAISHPRRGFITMGALAWAVISAWTATISTIAEIRWSHEYSLLLSTGYLDPRDKSGAPVFPWPLWAILAVAYVALIVAAKSKPRPPTP